MQNLTNVRRILTIDDTDAIHADFRKILLNSSVPARLADKKSFLFGNQRDARVRLRFDVDAAMQGDEGLKKVEESMRDNRPYSA